jgi:hypothetical protein
MKIYIASSWRNANGVELLTDELRRLGFGVVSWIENNYGEYHNHVTKKMDFEEWVNSPASDQSFTFDIDGAMSCDIFIYYAPAGMDAAAELGAAYGAGCKCGEMDKPKQIIGLWSKGENLGLMRKMVDRWFSRPAELIEYLKNNYK